MFRFHIPFIAAACLALTACNQSSVKEESAPELAPMQAIAQPAGYEQKIERNGEPLTATLMKREGGLLHWSMSNGCTFAKMELFAPTTSWSDCSANDGQQTVTKTEVPWPLQVGASWSYGFEGRNESGQTWSGTRECEVEKTARITTRSGTHDTFKVVCDDQYSRRTIYLSPEVKDYVLVERWHKRRGETTKFELLSAT